MAAPQERSSRNRKPSRLALQLTDAFAALDEWSEVKVIRNEFGRRDLIVAPLRPVGSAHHPYDWSAAA
ncbi:MAG: hypothetical protein ACR2G3_00340 [Solirubrobacterales bacterium]